MTTQREWQKISRELANGVVGAADVVPKMTLSGFQDDLLRLHRLGIVGEGIWVLFCDRCDKDIKELHKLIEISDDATLKRLARDIPSRRKN